MKGGKKYFPSREFQKKAAIKSFKQYKEIYKHSINDPQNFWAERAMELHWFKKWKNVLEYDFTEASVKWFEGGKINVSYNCLDRHLFSWRKNKAALIWIGENSDESKIYTYQMLHTEVSRFANVLRKNGIKKGDRVTMYLPMIPELAIAMLACARIGAIHSIVFGGFSAESLMNRIKDCGASLLITADGGFRGGRIIPLKQNADEALKNCPEVKKCIIVRRTNTEITFKKNRDSWWHDEITAPDIKNSCEPAVMDAIDPLFILYTSGSTGKPKGVLHSTGGYLLYANQTFKWVFDAKDEDTFWCTADIGWITGHSYIVYGPLSAGATSIMFEGVPTYPDPGKYWEIIEKFKVSIFYTAPTVIRLLTKYGEEWPKRYDLSSLRLLGSVGEVINPEAWYWYHKNIGQGKCPIVDTWWQTETGGVLIAPIPGAIPTKPASAGVPFPGVVPLIIKDNGKKARLNEGGYLVMTKPWPGMMQGVYGEPQRFKNTYFSQFPGMYFTGDGAKKDKDGYYWLMGRVDDVINVSGHRLGTAEIESAIVANSDVAEAAIVGYPHDIKGDGIYAFVSLKSGVKESEELKKKLIDQVRKDIGPIATPDKIQFTDTLPKTRSGKIMRRILRKIAAGDITDLGDLSTLADRACVDVIIKERL
ncbi:MAG: acetate--CoA ligase [Proteobacteria bacterium]|nr:acetate--CoA ligase [Desulfobacteraceae bacterium]MBU4013457.1 acetate--CoA ligase [Pseudomonadota bacterium]MBU4066683.1 acetate--CoA ligase [Pseudomonadota bacterium]MBU4100727.1 acetate--CoA ligase [Pseudomonadota bacterium]MBU4126099.1 acetate--CoA ligase [Pseudomonadota bacterium]